MTKEISIREIAKGLSNKEFVFYYQPIVSLVTGQICSSEALIRWQTKDGRVILPSEFIPLAESTGYISEITQEILPMVFKDLLRINESNKSISVSFNTSAKDFSDTRVVNTLSQQLSKYEIDPSRLHCEITETAFLPLDARTKQSLFDIRDMGLNIVLNDFSAGHSTVYYLSQLPFSALKIAMPLIQRTATSKMDFRLLRHLVSLGHQLHYDVIAEGVEDSEIHNLILSTGCSSAQGFYYSRPIPLEDFITLFNKQPSWVDFPYGMTYQTQLDLIDVTRDVIREAMIIFSNQDQQIKQRAKARLPDLEIPKTSFSKWYFEIKGYPFHTPEDFAQIGHSYNQFYATAIDLISLSEQNPFWEDLERKINIFKEHSENLTNMLIEIASNTLVSSFRPK